MSDREDERLQRLASELCALATAAEDAALPRILDALGRAGTEPAEQLLVAAHAIAELAAERRRALKQAHDSDERFRALSEASFEAVALHERGSIELANEAMARMFGCERASDLVGASARDLAAPASRELVLRNIASGYAQPYEATGLRRDGTEFPAELRGRTLRFRGREVRVTAIRDITERKQRELERERLLAEVTAALEERDVLLSEVHHRVKNNLQLVSSLLSLQVDHGGDPATLALLRECRDRVGAMALVHEHLYQSGSMAHLDFPAYLVGVVRMLLRSYGVSPDRVALEVVSDALALDLDTSISCGLVVTELVTNALKHAFPRGRRGQLRVEARVEAAGEHELIVADDGIGLPAEIDLDRARTLGLELVHMLVEQLRGSIHVERAGGTRFAIRFPARPRTAREP